MMGTFGLILLALVGVLVATTGLPAYLVLIFGAVIGAAVAVTAGGIPIQLFDAIPSRLIGLLESDLLQALPLFVLMGALLNRTAIVPALYRTLLWTLPRWSSMRLTAGLIVGALLGPMSGSVGASALALQKAVDPQLADQGVPPAIRQATIAVASTLGIVVPPSLVLILLGDAMLTAHTIAINATHREDRIINTQDVLRAAIVPAILFVGLCLIVSVLANRQRAADKPAPSAVPSWGDVAISIIAAAFLLVLLGGVATGYFYAVEAAAAGAVLLFVFGLGRGFGPGGLSKMLSEVLITTGALFAPLIAATTFTLTLRVLGTDKIIDSWINGLPGGAEVALAVGLLAILLAGFVLDAYEIILVVVPILVPPLLVRVPDAPWVAALVLLTLQASFLLPPVGYALIVTRGLMREQAPIGRVIVALAPYLAAQFVVLATVLAAPQLVHLLDAKGSNSRKVDTQLTPAEIEQRFRALSVPSVPALPGGLPPGLSPPGLTPPNIGAPDLGPPPGLAPPAVPAPQ